MSPEFDHDQETTVSGYNPQIDLNAHAPSDVESDTTEIPPEDTLGEDTTENTVETAPETILEFSAAAQERESERSMAAAAVLAAEPKPEGRFHKLWRERKVFVILSSLFLLLALGCIGVISYVYFIIIPFEDYDYILPNVYCAGVDLGGMTRKEAQAAIEDALRHPANTVTVKLPDASYDFCPAQEGITLNGAVIAEKAYRYLRTDTSAYGMYRAYQTAKNTEYQLSAETKLVYDLTDIETMAQTVHEETYIDATDSTASCDETNHQVHLTLGTPGRTIEPETIVEAVSEAFDNMDFQDISLDYTPVDIDYTDLWDLAKESEKTYSYAPVEPVNTADEETHTITVVMGTPGYSLKANDLYALAKESAEQGEYGTVTLDMTETLPEDVNVVAEYKTMACDPVEPYYASGDVQEGTNGYDMDWDAAIAAVKAASWGETVVLPMTETAPKKTADQVRAVLFRDELGSYSSPHTVNANRTTNLTLCCRAINGTVVNPGETFSFNGTVGQRTAAKGYKEAIVYIGTESVGELGGGICQVASTIYNAALYADMEITERECHTFFVTYVKGGLDATVYWGSQDFCFKNNTEYPIRINASVSGGYVYISIDGTKTNDNYVVLSSTQLSSTPYTTVYENDDTMAAGTQKETVSPYTGYVYEAYQYVYAGDGTLLETNYLGKSSYAKRNRVVKVGTRQTTPVPSTPSDTAESSDTVPSEPAPEETPAE